MKTVESEFKREELEASSPDWQKKVDPEWKTKVDPEWKTKVEPDRVTNDAHCDHLWARSPAGMTSSPMGFKLTKDDLKALRRLSAKEMSREYDSRENLSEARIKIRKAKASCKRIIAAPAFDLCMGFCVAVNAVCMVLEYEVPSGPWELLDHLFLILFSAEFFLRLFVFGLAFLRDGAAMLDATVVGTGWVFQWILPLCTRGMDYDDFQTLQVLKVMRVMRCVRILRMLTIFKDLWLIVSSFFESLTSLVWTVLFITIILFIFSMFGVELIGRSGTFSGTVAQDRFFQPLDGMLLLFQLMTFDDSMEIVMEAGECAQWSYVYFLLFICIGALALMNLVTAVVVEGSVKKVRDDAEYQHQLYNKEVMRHTSEIVNFWRGLGGENADFLIELDIDEFLEKGGESSWVLKIMTAFDLTGPEDLVFLFRLLDTDRSGAVSVHEAIRGILKLQRLADHRDVMSMTKATENKSDKHMALRKAFEEVGDDVPTQLAQITTQLRRMEMKLGKGQVATTARERKLCGQESIHSVSKSQKHRAIRLKNPTALPGIPESSVASKRRFGSPSKVASTSLQTKASTHCPAKATEPAPTQDFPVSSALTPTSAFVLQECGISPSGLGISPSALDSSPKKQKPAQQPSSSKSPPNMDQQTEPGQDSAKPLFSDAITSLEEALEGMFDKVQMQMVESQQSCVDQLYAEVADMVRSHLGSSYSSPSYPGSHYSPPSWPAYLDPTLCCSPSVPSLRSPSFFLPRRRKSKDATGQLSDTPKRLGLSNRGLAGAENTCVPLQEHAASLEIPERHEHATLAGSCQPESNPCKNSSSAPSQSPDAIDEEESHGNGMRPRSFRPMKLETPHNGSTPPMSLQSSEFSV